jgi:phage FluMu gp28-like protein
LITATPAVETQPIKPILKPHQLRFVNDPCPRRLWVKSAQIGGSTAAACRHMMKCLQRENHLSVFLSASEAQAKELVLKAKKFLMELGSIDSTILHNILPGRDDLQEHMIRFPNGSRIISLSSNPDICRGYSGDIILDEMAFHPYAEEIYRVAYRQISLGFSLDILSTPNGIGNRFHAMAQALGLDRGIEPDCQPVVSKGETWSGHWTSLDMAVREGWPANPAAIRAGLGSDFETWRQEYCCEFLATGNCWIPPELYSACVDPAASAGQPPERFGLYAGWDIARSRDMSVIWFVELLGDVIWTKGIIVFENTPTPVQVREACAWMPYIRRVCVDSSGMGLSITEALQYEFPDKVEAVKFTQQTKESMAVYLKRKLEERKLRLPDDDRCRRSFAQLKRTTTATGNFRFDASHDAKLGHGDFFWACALALQAANLPIGDSFSSSDAWAPETKPICHGWMTEVF